MWRAAVRARAHVDLLAHEAADGRAPAIVEGDGDDRQQDGRGERGDCSARPGGIIVTLGL